MKGEKSLIVFGNVWWSPHSCIFFKKILLMAYFSWSQNNGTSTSKQSSKKKRSKKSTSWVFFHSSFFNGTLIFTLLFSRSSHTKCIFDHLSIHILNSMRVPGVHFTSTCHTYISLSITAMIVHSKSHQYFSRIQCVSLIYMMIAFISINLGHINGVISIECVNFLQLSAGV